MKISSFLKLVEIQTKAASMIPFTLGTMYALYRYNSFILKNFLLMLVSLLCVDMATTAINNYMDFKKAKTKQGFGYEIHNAISRDNLRKSHVIAVIFILFAIATASGIVLFLNTSVVVLALGAVSFFVGILYSFGPIPISRTPFGEIFSGFFMGCIIPFIAVYIHVFDQGLLSISLNHRMLDISLDMVGTVHILLLTVPAATGIANIMLANNICDIEEDIKNKRYTLPIFIGRNNSLKVFRALYYAGYLSLAVLLAIRAVPLISVLTFGTLFMVEKNIRTFYIKQTKKDTFVLAVKNFVVVNGALVLTIGAALF